MTPYLTVALYQLRDQRPGFDPWVGKVPRRRDWLPTPVFWPREFHSPWSRKELATTEQLSLSFSQAEWLGQ